MKKIRKGQKKILIILLAVIVAVIAIVLIVKIVNKKPENPPSGGIEYEPVIQLEDTTYSGMEVRNIQVKLLKDNDEGRGETVLSMEIHNTTTEKVENEKFTAILLGPDEEIIGQMPTSITKLDVGEQFNTQVVLDGDLTAVKQIKLIER
jgi:hypothetical protein